MRLVFPSNISHFPQKSTVFAHESKPYGPQRGQFRNFGAEIFQDGLMAARNSIGQP
jgi:hypothetical protein